MLLLLLLLWCVGAVEDSSVDTS